MSASDGTSQHTPGPWLYRLESTRYVIQHEPEDSIGLRAIAVTAGAYPLSGANARLIAAAPVMLAALRKADEFIRNGIELGFIRMPDRDVPDPAHRTPGIVAAAIVAANLPRSTEEGEG